ncbi:DNA-binding domain-containing protein, AraC-type [Lachnospiraceae bacterium JC7]|nr:DNA-binding domain-containing protein, AraC-type [Lachnospiraceae bacterium JC7]
MINILLIDDDRNIIDGLEKIIRENFSAGTFEIKKCLDGSEALRSMRDTFFHIIISDVKMPNLDGISLLRILHEQNIDSKVIVLSGYDNYSYVRDTLKLGAFDYLLKPVDIKTFCNILSILRNTVSTGSLQERFISSETDISFNDIIESSKNNYFDITPVEPYLDENSLQTELEQLCDYVLNCDEGSFRVNVENIFSHISERTITPTAFKQEMTKYVYKLMNKNSSLIEIISKYKLSENDLSGQIKGQILLSQLKSRFISINLLYMRELNQLQHKKDEYLIRKATDYIDKHYSEQIMLSDIAEQFHIHPNYFSALFKNQMGITIRDYILQKRIDIAKALISSSLKKISDIAVEVGYQDSSHFNRAFKNVTGMSPAKYRKIVSDESKIH